MFTLRPQARFVLRGSPLLIGMLALWWFVLQTPMMFLLRLSESVVLRLLSSSDSREPIAVNPSGDWDFRIAVEDAPSESTQGVKAVKLRAIEFTIPRLDVVLFTFSVPVFWAMVLAAPMSKSALRALLWGTALVSIIEVLSLLALLEITAYGVIAQAHPSAGGLATWSREVANNLVVGVIPFATPVLAAVALHRDFRSQIFPISHPSPASGPVSTKRVTRRSKDPRRP